MFRQSTSLVLASLRQSSSITSENLRGLSTPSEQIAWACGSHGTYLRTTDQGKNWEVAQIQEEAKTLEFRDIKAFDINTAYIMSSGPLEESRLYKTVDGGITWMLQLKGSSASEFFDCMAFWDRDHGMVLSDPVDGKFKLYVTENGGNSWVPIPASVIPASLENESAYAASGTCMTAKGTLDAWFGTSKSRVFHTSNGGKNWEVVKTPIMCDSPTSGIFSIAFYDLKNGVIAGGDYKNPDKGGSNVAITDDGGMTWTLCSLSPQYYWSAVSFSMDHERLMLVGSKQSGLTNSSSPFIWEKTWHYDGLNALSCWSKERALAVGQAGMIRTFEMPK